MRQQNIFLKIIFLLWISPKVVTNYIDYFPDFYCGIQAKLKPQKCEIWIFSTKVLQEVFQHLEEYDFKNENLNRSDISNYNEFEFITSTFEKFPTGSFGSLSHVKSMTAQNVKLSTLNRDSLTSFTSLEFLDLSHNNIQSLENNILSHLKSLKSFNISNNQIENISKDAFDEYGKNLTDVDLSHNYIKTVNARIFETLGIMDQINLYLCCNDIEEVTVSKAQFKLLDLHYNQLKYINVECKEIYKHLYFDDYVEEVRDTDFCKIDYLNLSKNPLISIEIFNTSSLDISNNINIKNIKLNITILRRLVASNVSSEAINYEFLQTASQLTKLDMSNTFLGTPKIDTFSEMTQLEDLKLRNTGLSHIEYGMFSHQVNMKNFDISYNNLGHIDIEMLASMKDLESLDISGNNLSSFNDANDFKKYFPNLTLIGIEENNWNCSYLTKIVKVFDENSISLKQPTVLIKGSSNVMGIGCTTTSNQKIKPIDVDHANDLFTQKLNGIIEEMNKLKEFYTSSKKEGNCINSTSSYGSYIDTGITSIILTAIFTIVVVIGVMFGYLKFKNIYCRRYETPSVLARSTNSSTMAVEISQTWKQDGIPTNSTQTPSNNENFYEIPLSTSKSR